MNDVLYDVWFSVVLFNRQDIFNCLIEKYGNAKQAFERFTDEDLLNLSDKQKDNMKRRELKQAEKIVLRCEKENVEIITQNSGMYPKLLKYTDMPPAVLYAKGNLDLLKAPKVTVIGSREHDKEGTENAIWFSRELMGAGIQVVAGFAEGIEANVNKTALSSIVILPCGINYTYPAKHFRLRNSIMQNGGLFLTEYPFGTNAYKENFLFRNRLLAGISDATVFIQCGAKSGTSHTFNWDALYGRDAFVIPGSIYNKYYQNSNRYIKEGGILVTSPSEVIAYFYAKYPYLVKKEMPSFPNEEQIFTIDNSLLENFSEDEKKIVKALSQKTLHIDDIVKEVNISIADLSVYLVNLELFGIVEKCEGNRYKIKR